MSGCCFFGYFHEKEKIIQLTGTQRSLLIIYALFVCSFFPMILLTYPPITTKNGMRLTEKEKCQ